MRSSSISWLSTWSGSGTQQSTGQTAAHWGSSKSYALGTLIRNDEVVIFRDRVELVGRFDLPPSFEGIEAGYAGAVGDGPLHAPLVDGVVGAFWFAGPAVNALVGNHDCHSKVFYAIRNVWVVPVFTGLQK